MSLPAPLCGLGFTSGQLDEVLRGRRGEFDRWMAGQTCAVCDGRRYNHEQGGYEASGCGPHGVVVYKHDLVRFLLGGRPLD